jgi:small GTP-binding protein
VQLWDTAGQERYRSMVTTYYQQAHGIIMVYDIANRESFEGLSFWKEIIDNKCSEDTKILLIGNKSDLDTIREISTKEGEELAQKNDYFFMETSAKKNLTGEVGEAFKMIIHHLARKEIEKLPVNGYSSRPQSVEPVFPVDHIKKTNCC